MTPHRHVTGSPVDDFRRRRRTSWDFSDVADGRVFLLLRGKDFEVQVESIAAAARRWAREHNYKLKTQTEFDESRKVGLRVQFERQTRR